VRAAARAITLAFRFVAGGRPEVFYQFRELIWVGDLRDVPGSVDGLQAGAGQPPCQDLRYLAEAWTRDAAIGQLQRRVGSREFGKLEGGSVRVGLLVTEDRGIEHEGVPHGFG
jgi:hypothetical protein